MTDDARFLDAFNSALEKLEWAAKRNDGMSADLSPDESRAVLRYVEFIEEKAEERRKQIKAHEERHFSTLYETPTPGVVLPLRELLADESRAALDAVTGSREPAPPIKSAIRYGGTVTCCYCEATEGVSEPTREEADAIAARFINTHRACYPINTTIPSSSIEEHGGMF